MLEVRLSNRTSWFWWVFNFQCSTRMYTSTYTYNDNVHGRRLYGTIKSYSYTPCHSFHLSCAWSRAAWIATKLSAPLSIIVNVCHGHWRNRSGTGRKRSLSVSEGSKTGCCMMTALSNSTMS